MSAIDDVMKYIATNEIRWLDLQFFDIKGVMHRISVSNRKIDENMFGDGISVADLNNVFGPNTQGELVLLPDPNTIARLPWEPATVRLICDVLVAIKHERFLKDPRYVAERMETNLSAAGIKDAIVGSSVECYMFDTATADKSNRPRGVGLMMDSREAVWGPSPLSNVKSGAYVATPYDGLYAARTQICETMEDSFGMLVDSHCHGRSPTAQQSFELGPRTLKSAADSVNTLKFITKNLAAAVSAQATFMPYPIEGEKGNAYEISTSFWKTSDTNVFYDSKEKDGQFSQTGRYFVGGLLEHAAALSLFTAPTPNSYHRLAIEEMSMGWSMSDKNTLVFVPYTQKNTKEATRVVYKGADPSANPYLANALVCAAGLDGIKQKIEPGDPVEKEGDKKNKRVRKDLPSSLYEAISALESDTKFIKGLLPAELLGDYLDLKLKQHKEAMKGVSGLELQKYFNV
ncbi:glutamine synthetase family protein [Candidatus Micrarchaeota archaeon]|nr:glutamine synthetase family protein [Candidatus Micrarchaeota archaeon]MBU1166101.1 glutamine synthetase family protein [Candidatus Micrarchaeota archaeon]MBU1886098.1 glutamine synthetase family protein [Candidatus Micrarchaeota archaeon]